MARIRRERRPASCGSAMYWASGCGGCDISLLEIGQHLLELIEVADVVFWPCAADFKYARRRGLPGRLHRRLPLQRRRAQLRARGDRAPAAQARAGRSSPTARARCDGGIPALANLKPPRGDLRRRLPRQSRRSTTREGVEPQPRTADAVRRSGAAAPLRARPAAGGRRRRGLPDSRLPAAGRQVWKVLQALAAGEVPARNAAVKVGCGDKAGLRRVLAREAQVRDQGVPAPAPGHPRAGLVPARAGLRLLRAGDPKRLRRPVHEGGDALPRLLRRQRARGGQGTALHRRTRFGAWTRRPKNAPANRSTRSSIRRAPSTGSAWLEHAQGTPRTVPGSRR